LGSRASYDARMLKLMTSTTPDDGKASRDQRWAALIRRIGRGDVDALGAFYDESSMAVFPLVLQILPNRQSAEEALLDIYNQVREQAGRFNPRRQSAVDWLITLARNFAVARLQSNLPQAATVVEDAFRSDRRLANLTLAGLSEEQRSILEMTYLAGLTVDEVARLVGTSREHVAKQIVFGMRVLKASAQNPTAERVRSDRTRCLQMSGVAQS
jgi:RNA polymerase sigma factor (sigma-70 family)